MTRMRMHQFCKPPRSISQPPFPNSGIINPEMRSLDFAYRFGVEKTEMHTALAADGAAIGRLKEISVLCFVLHCVDCVGHGVR